MSSSQFIWINETFLSVVYALNFDIVIFLLHSVYGCAQFSVHTRVLDSYSIETRLNSIILVSGDSQDKLSKFKRWFWSIVESMTPKQKQEMVCEITHSPLWLILWVKGLNEPYPSCPDELFDFMIYVLLHVLS